MPFCCQWSLNVGWSQVPWQGGSLKLCLLVNSVNPTNYLVVSQYNPFYNIYIYIHVNIIYRWTYIRFIYYIPHTSSSPKLSYLGSHLLSIRWATKQCPHFPSPASAPHQAGGWWAVALAVREEDICDLGCVRLVEQSRDI
jgi:hypothetical protein